MKKTALAASLVMALGTGAATAAPVNTGGVFNMCSQTGLDTTGICTPGATPINVDASITGFVDETAGTWGVASTTTFFGLLWTASNGQLISTAGSYQMDTVTGAVTSPGTGVVAADGVMNFDVGAGQVGATIDFAYGTTVGIRVINVWDVNPDGSVTGVMIPGMENGPFPGFNAQFNLTAAGLLTPPPAAIPVPAAVWLFGSGLVGLVGVARRKKLRA